MMLIDKEKLLQDIDTALAATGYEHEVPAMVAEAMKVMVSRQVAEAMKVMVSRQPEVKLPPEREPDPNDGASGYWFDKGWNAAIEEFKS